jgi:N5-(carboxyethyl)ornithine synthase
MDIAVIGTSKKENEKRVAIHPNHISHIPKKIRKHLFFEKGYGIPFDMEDETIYSLTGNSLLDRKELFENFKAILITKPTAEDFEEMQDGTLVWGWIHSVQQSIIAQIAIDKKLTLVAWENMNYKNGRELLHIFNKNNEMAGYCGVQHALQLLGIDGQYGPKRKVAVISQGSVSRGAIFALKGHSFSDITVYTQRPSFLVANKIPGVQYKQIIKNNKGELNTLNLFMEKTPLLNELIAADIIVNGILQDISNPVNFIKDNDIEKITKPCLVIDISCDEGMGFSFALPTTFSNPILNIGMIKYYAVDHTPTLLWNSASWEISKCVLPYLQYIVEELDNNVLKNAVDIKAGKIINKEILSFQNRSLESPYDIIKIKPVR